MNFVYELEMGMKVKYKFISNFILIIKLGMWLYLKGVWDKNGFEEG